MRSATGNYYEVGFEEGIREIASAPKGRTNEEEKEREEKVEEKEEEISWRHSSASDRRGNGLGRSAGLQRF